jgi:hypothetical protein
MPYRSPLGGGEDAGIEAHACVLKKPFGLSFEESHGRPLVVGVHSRQAQEAGVAVHAVLKQVLAAARPCVYLVCCLVG